MENEDDYLPISALQHLVFCPRQCALIHIEQAWDENMLTAQGRQLHDRAHDGEGESRGDLRIVRGLRLCSRALGLTGQADVVELRRPGPDTPRQQRAAVPDLDGLWTVRPVEYKRGRPKAIDCDRVQLCAQAMCLEEMLAVSIPDGSLFYGQPHRREEVDFDQAIRDQTRRATEVLHRLIKSGKTPPAEYSTKCKSCSLAGVCLPKRTADAGIAERYLRKQLAEATSDDPVGESGHEDS